MIKHIAYCHPANREDGVAAQLFYEDTALILTDFHPKGKVTILQRSSFIGPLIEEGWGF